MRGASHSVHTCSSATSSAARASARASAMAPTPSTSAAGRIMSRTATGSTPSTWAAVSGQRRMPRNTNPPRTGTRSARRRGPIMLAATGVPLLATTNSDTQPSGQMVCSAASPTGKATSMVQRARTCSANGSGGGCSPSKNRPGASASDTSGGGRVERCMLGVDPASMIRRILDRERLLRDAQRTEGVHHHRELVRVRRPDRRFGATRMRPVRNAVGVQRDRPELDPLPAHELARRIVEHLVRVHVAVVVRRGHGFRMEVVRPRTERADDEAVALEGLVHRGRLVHATDDRLEVVDVERPRVELAVPPDDVERMMIEDDLVQSVVLLHDDAEVAHLVVRLQLARHADVALRVRRALDELAELVAVPLGWADVPAPFHDQQLRRLRGAIEAVAMHDATVDDEIVTLPEGEIAVLRLEVPLPLGDVHDFVRLRVAIEMLVLHVRLDVEHRDVLIEEERDAVERRTAAALRLRRAEVAMPERRVGIRLEL